MRNLDGSVGFEACLKLENLMNQRDCESPVQYLPATMCGANSVRADRAQTETNVHHSRKLAVMSDLLLQVTSALL